MVARHAKRSRVYEYEDAEMIRGCENLRAGLPTAGDEKVGKLVKNRHGMRSPMMGRP